MTERAFKDEIYEQFARLGQALSSAKRLEIVDLLAQAPRNVETISKMTGMSVANTSQHLQALKQARIVEAEREGTKVTYRLASPEITELWVSLQRAAEARLTELSEIAARYAIEGGRRDLVARDAIGKSVVLLDVRPEPEFAAGHLPGATSVPLESLIDRISTLSRSKTIVVYCRGEYCHSADEAVVRLRDEGFKAVRLDGGWPEWVAENRPIERGVSAAGGR